MTLSSIVSFLHATGATTQAQINKIIEELHETTPPIKGDTKSEKIFLFDEIRTRTSTVTGVEDRLIDEKKDREDSW